MNRLCLWALIAFSFFSCSSDKLYIQSNYFTHEDLASVFAGTHDKRKKGVMLGQKLLVVWSLKREEMVGNVKLMMYLRYRNYEDDVKIVPLKKRHGRYLLRLEGDEFEEKGGILSYKVQIVKESGEILEQWVHQIWADRLLIED